MMNSVPKEVQRMAMRQAMSMSPKQREDLAKLGEQLFNSRKRRFTDTPTEEDLKKLTSKEIVREKLKELSIELQNLTSEQNNNMWQTLGGTLVPAACYKVRMLTLVDTQVVETGTVLHVLDVIHGNPQISEQERMERIQSKREEANAKYHPETIK